MKTLLLILALSLSVAAQAKMPNKWFSSEYDKFKERTTIGFIDVSRPLEIQVEFNFAGKTLASDIAEFELYFIGGRCSGYCFNDPQVIFLIDGERVDLGVQDDVLENNLGIFVKRDLVTRFANAKTVEYQVGRYEGKWEQKTLAKFKTLLDLATVAK